MLVSTRHVCRCFCSFRRIRAFSLVFLALTITVTRFSSERQIGSVAVPSLMPLILKEIFENTTMMDSPISASSVVDYTSHERASLLREILFCIRDGKNNRIIAATAAAEGLRHCPCAIVAARGGRTVVNQNALREVKKNTYYESSFKRRNHQKTNTTSIPMLVRVSVVPALQ